MKPYKPRPIRFLGHFVQQEWKIKLYSISDRHEFVLPEYVEKAKKELKNWLQKSTITSFENYKIATLMLHECKEGCFAIINWWVDDNMLQHYVYLSRATNEKFREFSSQTDIITCVWELSILWFERNAWVKHVIATEKPNIEAYLSEQLNQD